MSACMDYEDILWWKAATGSHREWDNYYDYVIETEDEGE